MQTVALPQAMQRSEAVQTFQEKDSPLVIQSRLNR
jgi:hypothetical protein